MLSTHLWMFRALSCPWRFVPALSSGCLETVQSMLQILPEPALSRKRMRLGSLVVLNTLYFGNARMLCSQQKYEIVDEVDTDEKKKKDKTDGGFEEVYTIPSHFYKLLMLCNNVVMTIYVCCMFVLWYRVKYMQTEEKASAVENNVTFPAFALLIPLLVYSSYRRFPVKVSVNSKLNKLKISYMDVFARTAHIVRDMSEVEHHYSAKGKHIFIKRKGSVLDWHMLDVKGKSEKEINDLMTNKFKTKRKPF